MRAYGVHELAAHLRGEIDLPEVERRRTLVTGQYTNRQTTWFRHHELAPNPQTHTIHAWIADRAQFSEQNFEGLVTFVRDPG